MTQSGKIAAAINPQYTVRAVRTVMTDGQIVSVTYWGNPLTGGKICNRTVTDTGQDRGYCQSTGWLRRGVKCCPSSVLSSSLGFCNL